jgi:1-acyl-sn-glycerol-3-phosphate acyltransferase
MIYTLRGVTATLFISISTVFWCTPLYLMGLARFLLPIKQIRTRLAHLMDLIIDGWVFSNRFMVRCLHITHIEKPPLLAELDRNHWNVVVCNHQSWTDILVLQNTLLGHIPPLKFFTKKELIYVPLVGIAMWLLGFPYVRRYSRAQLEKNPSLHDHDRNATLQACQGFLERPTSVLNFLEGTRYSEEKKVGQHSPYVHLLLPKTGGLGHVCDALDQQIDNIIDVTIVYPDGTPGFWEFLCGRCTRIYFQARRYPTPPVDRNDRKAWADGLWREKDLEISRTFLHRPD